MPDEQEIKNATDKAKKELADALVKKRQADKLLVQLENQIHKLETSYLNETSSYGGNIILGFENYLKNTGPGKKKHEIVESDRMFSNSSATYTKSIEMLNDSDSEGERNGSNSGLVTLKRERDREYQRKKRANNKRAMSIASAEEPEIIPKRTTKRQRMQDEGILAD